MGLRYSSVVAAPVGEVFAWHARPGAIARLTPPWQPVGVRVEADSLRDGHAVLGLPGGLRWVAAHQPEAYDPPYRFVDELVNPPLATMLPWRHTHAFTAETATTTRLTDIVDTPLPALALRAMFAYRHIQLADDLAVQSRARDWQAESEPDRPVVPLTVAVTGASGLVGTAVCALLSTGGHRVLRLTRRPARTADERQWRPDDPSPDLFVGVDVVIHLAGASIAGRFTAAHKAEIRDSRVEPTRRLAEAAVRAAAGGGGPRAFVSASAVGYYGADRGEEILAEDSPRGSGYLADLVADWEAATNVADAAGLRTVVVRTGLVQSPRGGLLRVLYPLFAAGLGGRLGDGRQWLPWIGIDDLADIYLRTTVHSGLSGVVNAVAPGPVRAARYTHTLARVLRRPALLPIPAIGPRLVLGAEGARELADTNQHVRPQRLLDAGHRFRHPALDPALRHVLGRIR